MFSIGAISSFLTLMMLVILVFALVGMSLFGGGYRGVEVSQSMLLMGVRGLDEARRLKAKTFVKSGL